MSRTPSFMPQVRQFSQADQHVVQRPEGISGPGDESPEVEDIRQGRLEKYSGLQVSPGRFDDSYGYTAQPMFNQGGEVVLLEKDLSFVANSLLVDNWTNQWLYEPNMRRSIPPYSGGWVMITPKGFQKARVLLRAPNSAYAPAAALAGEWVWVGWHEAILPPQAGIVILTRTPVVA